MAIAIWPRSRPAIRTGSSSPIFEGLQQSVTYGMGRMAQPDAPMKVAGKTGTAMADEGPWTHAWFAGYAPAENPEIVLVVFLEKGHGGTDAAGVAREIFAAFAADHGAGVADSRKGSAEMKRPLAIVGLLLLLCAAGDAELGDRGAAKASRTGFPQTVRVRLWYLHPPRELRIRADAGRAQMRTCATCTTSTHHSCGPARHRIED